MKEFTKSLGKYLFNKYAMNFPSRRVRKFFAKKFCKFIGDNVFIGIGVQLRGAPKNITIGHHTIINPKIILDGRKPINIGNNVDIGENTIIWTVEHDPNDNNHGVKSSSVTIEDYVWIATNVTILPGITIGKGSVIACNSVVTKDIAPMTIAGGIPAKKIATRENNLEYILNYNPRFL
jgi:maltose O-acetyltransferase